MDRNAKEGQERQSSHQDQIHSQDVPQRRFSHLRVEESQMICLALGFTYSNQMHSYTLIHIDTHLIPTLDSQAQTYTYSYSLIHIRLINPSPIIIHIMDKEESFVNDELNMAFVEDSLNKTISQSSSNWNLLDDPCISDKQEQTNLSQTNLSQTNLSFSMLSLEQSVVGPQNNKTTSHSKNVNISMVGKPVKPLQQDQQDDLLQMMQMIKPSSSKNKKK